MDGGRRAFLRGSLLTREGRAEETVRQSPLGPPPPWHQKLPLADHCLNCSHPCIAACEPGIISLHPLDHEQAGIPYLDFSQSGCTFCQDCVRACPIDITITPAIKPIIGTAILNQTICIAWDDVICMTCHDRCDYQAINTEHQRRARVDTDRCNGCGMCAAVCPMHAMTVISKFT